jgi:hypothetical protein
MLVFHLSILSTFEKSWKETKFCAVAPVTAAGGCRGFYRNMIGNQMIIFY